MGERLRGEDEQRGVAPVGDDRLDDRHLVAERLPRRGAGRDDDARAGRAARRSPRPGACRADRCRAPRSGRRPRWAAARPARANCAGRAGKHLAMHEPADEIGVGRERVEQRRTRPSGRGYRPPATRTTQRNLLEVRPAGASRRPGRIVSPRQRVGRVCAASRARRAARLHPGGVVSGRFIAASKAGTSVALATVVLLSLLRRVADRAAKSVGRQRDLGRSGRHPAAAGLEGHQGRQGRDPARERRGERGGTGRARRVGRVGRGDGRHDPAREGGPDDEVLQALSMFQSCLKGLSVKFIGMPDQANPNSPTNDPTTSRRCRRARRRATSCRR